MIQRNSLGSIFIITLIFATGFVLLSDAIALSNLELIGISCERLLVHDAYHVKFDLVISVYNPSIFPAWICYSYGRLLLAGFWVGNFFIDSFFVSPNSHGVVKVHIIVNKIVNLSYVEESIEISVDGIVIIGTGFLPMKYSFNIDTGDAASSVFVEDIKYLGNGEFLVNVTAESPMIFSNVRLGFDLVVYYNKTSVLDIITTHDISLDSRELKLSLRAKILSRESFEALLGDQLVKQTTPEISLNLTLKHVNGSESLCILLYTYADFAVEYKVSIRVNDIVYDDDRLVINLTLTITNPYSMDINITRVHIEVFADNSTLSIFEITDKVLRDKNSLEIPLMINVTGEQVVKILEAEELRIDNSFIKIQIQDLELTVPIRLIVELEEKL